MTTVAPAKTWPSRFWGASKAGDALRAVPTVARLEEKHPGAILSASDGNALLQARDLLEAGQGKRLGLQGGIGQLLAERKNGLVDLFEHGNPSWGMG